MTIKAGGGARMKIPGRPPTQVAQKRTRPPVAARSPRPKIAEHVKTQKVRAEGVAGVEDSRSAGRTFKVRAAAARSQGASIELPPARPPAVRLSAELVQGAESFIGTLDLIVDGLLFKDGAIAPPPPECAPRIQRAALELLEAIPLGTSHAGLTSDGSPEGERSLPAGRQIIGHLFDLRAGTPEGAPLPEALGVAADQIRSLDEVNAGALMALFLKLNISDPNNSVETHNDLHEMASSLRQQAIDDAQAKIEVAQELRAEVEAAMQEAEVVNLAAQILVMVLALVVAVIITVLTAGAATAPAVAGVAGAVSGGSSIGASVAAQVSAQVTAQMVAAALVESTTSSIVQVATLIAAATQAAVQSFGAAKTEEAKLASLDAREANVDADRARQRAEREQQVIEEEGAIIKLIMEAKNQAVDAVTKMLASQMDAQQTVLASGMVR